MARSNASRLLFAREDHHWQALEAEDPRKVVRGVDQDGELDRRLGPVLSCKGLVAHYKSQSHKNHRK